MYGMRCQLDYGAGGIVLSFDGGRNCSYEIGRAHV